MNNNYKIYKIKKTNNESTKTGKKHNPTPKFNEELTEGIITKRKGQFIFYVKIKGKEYKCHCPTTGGVGGIIFKNIPCLCSKSTNKKRIKDYTVEAISVNNKITKNKKWSVY